MIVGVHRTWGTRRRNDRWKHFWNHVSLVSSLSNSCSSIAVPVLETLLVMTIELLVVNRKFDVMVWLLTSRSICIVASRFSKTGRGDPPRSCPMSVFVHYQNSEGELAYLLQNLPWYLCSGTKMVTGILG